MTKQTLAILSAALLAAPAARAFTYAPGDSVAGGIGYTGEVTIGAGESGSFSSHVGAWSWEDQSLFNAGAGEPPVGWTHTSNWIAVHVTSATVLSLTMSRDAAVPYLGSGNVGGFAAVDEMYPSFSVWQNLDNDLAPQTFADAFNGGTPTDDWHTYNNRGAVAWAEDLVYLGNVENSSLTSVTGTFTLAPGDYTFAFGSNAPSTNSPPRQGYQVAFSAAPVPEPGSVALLVLAAAATLRRRRA